jgi:hypothetical protein
MIFPTKSAFVQFVRTSNLPVTEQDALIEIVVEHHTDGEISVIGDCDDVIGLTFTSDHDVQLVLDIGFAIIRASSSPQSPSKVYVTKETKMSEQAQAQNKSAAPVEADMEATLAMMKAIIDESVASAVQAALEKKEAERAAKENGPEAQRNEPTQAPVATPDKGGRATVMSPWAKAAAYTAGAAAVAAGGWYAWKKFGTQST